MYISVYTYNTYKYVLKNNYIYTYIFVLMMHGLRLRVEGNRPRSPGPGRASRASASRTATPPLPAPPIGGQLLRRNKKRFRGGLVCQAYRLVHHSTLG